jgi:hypothetical protein
MVTSSAVVGSSAISRRGLHAIAIAIITRWFMPPLIWCGKSLRRLSRRECRRARELDRALASLLVVHVECRRSVSASWKPMVKHGLRLVVGSWKIIATSRR